LKNEREQYFTPLLVKRGSQHDLKKKEDEDDMEIEGLRED
jgi:hypothetical protein